jgi:hypothetical protein
MKSWQTNSSNFNLLMNLSNKEVSVEMNVKIYQCQRWKVFICNSKIKRKNLTKIFHNHPKRSLLMKIFPQVFLHQLRIKTPQLLQREQNIWIEATGKMRGLNLWIVFREFHKIWESLTNGEMVMRVLWDEILLKKKKFRDWRQAILHQDIWLLRMKRPRSHFQFKDSTSLWNRAICYQVMQRALWQIHTWHKICWKVQTREIVIKIILLKWMSMAYQVVEKMIFIRKSPRIEQEFHLHRNKWLAKEIVRLVVFSECQALDRRYQLKHFRVRWKFSRTLDNLSIYLADNHLKIIKSFQ